MRYAIKVLEKGQWFFLADVTEGACILTASPRAAQVFASERDAEATACYLPAGSTWRIYTFRGAARCTRKQG